ASADFKKLFSLSGASDNTGVSFLIGTGKTKAATGAPVKVNVTAPATQAVVVASATPGSVALIPANPTLQFKLNSLLTSGVSLPPGPYSSTSELLAAVQKAINAAQSSSDNYVSIALNGDGKVQITTQKYGTAASIAITGGTPEVLSALGFSGTETASGTNVAGNFVVGGTTEAATGSGQVLSGNSGNATTDGLQVTSTLTAAGSANVTVTQGLASRLSQVLSSYLDPAVGRLKAVNDSFNQKTADLDKTIAKQQTILDTKTADLQAQFAAMETAVNNLKGIQTQLASFTVPTSK
ncbi:MAG TPA: flagellar filament capping protein FliD, partial [Gemmata sp.]